MIPHKQLQPQRKQGKATKYENSSTIDAVDQGFSTLFCSWPTKLVRNGVGPDF